MISENSPPHSHRDEAPVSRFLSPKNIENSATGLQNSVDLAQAIANPILEAASAIPPQTQVIKAAVRRSTESFSSFWIAVLAGEFKDGDTIYIEYSGEKEVSPCILSMQYRFYNDPRGQNFDRKEFGILLEHPSTKKTMYRLRGDSVNGEIKQIRVIRDIENIITIPAEKFERNYLVSKEKIFPRIEFRTPSPTSEKSEPIVTPPALQQDFESDYMFYDCPGFLDYRVKISNQHY